MDKPDRENDDDLDREIHQRDLDRDRAHTLTAMADQQLWEHDLARQCEDDAAERHLARQLADLERDGLL